MSATKNKKTSKVGKAMGFFGNWIVRNVLLAIVFVLGFVAVISILLALFTQHNKELTVPDFTNLTYQECRQLASHSGVKAVLDDSLYVRRLKPGVVYSQTPKPGEKVKKGRHIFLTTNTIVPKQVSMPSLVGFSMRQAHAELVRNGLVLGRLIYVNDMATNNVLRQQYDGKDIHAGDKIISGSTINLVVGLSGYENKTHIPNVVGRQYQKAVDLVHDNSLNIGKITFDDTVTNYADSINAVVYAQKPGPKDPVVRMGSEVSLFLTNDPAKVGK